MLSDEVFHLSSTSLINNRMGGKRIGRRAFEGGSNEQGCRSKEKKRRLMAFESLWLLFLEIFDCDCSNSVIFCFWILSRSETISTWVIRQLTALSLLWLYQIFLTCFLLKTTRQALVHRAKASAGDLLRPWFKLLLSLKLLNLVWENSPKNPYPMSTVVFTWWWFLLPSCS